MPPQYAISQTPPAPGYPLLTPDALRLLERPPSIVEGILPAGSLAMLSGPTNVFKSFLALHMGLCVATGTAFYGHAVRAGSVLYIAAEGQWGLPARLLAWEADHGLHVPTDRFRALLEPVNLRWGTEGALGLLASLDQDGQRPVLIIVDTMNQCFGGGDENSSVDMRAFLGSLRLLRERIGASVLVIHHSTKSNSSSLRGHGSLEADPDVHYVVSRSPSGNPDEVEVTCQKMKDGASFASLVLGGRSVTYTHPKTGQDDSSLVFDLIDVAQGTTRTIAAKETVYKNYTFRSQLEARWAIFMDTLGVRWMYESKQHDLGAAGMYTTDFLLHDLDRWLEIKPMLPTAGERAKAIALARKTGRTVFMFFACLAGASGVAFDAAGRTHEGMSWGICSACNRACIGDCEGCARGKMQTTSPRLSKAWEAARAAQFGADSGPSTLEEKIKAVLSDAQWHTAADISSYLPLTQDQLRRPLEQLCKTKEVVREKCDGSEGRRGTWRYRLEQPLDLRGLTVR